MVICLSENPPGPEGSNGNQNLRCFWRAGSRELKDKLHRTSGPNQVRSVLRINMFKIIQDPIWGPIEVKPEFLQIIDTKEFQRLHWIAQLGLCHMVFPGATHTRFQHSLGTMYIAEKMGEKLNSKHMSELKAAALLHDIGHFPFSHSFESFFKEKYGISHESVSIDIISGREGSGQIKEIMEKHHIDPDTVVSILAKSGEFPLEERIVSGPIDSDEIDYLARDSYFTGVNLLPFDFRRIVSVLMTDGESIFIEQKGIPAIESLLISRFLMYKSVYFHKTVRIIQKMVSRAVDMEYPEKRTSSMKDIQFLDLLERGKGGDIIRSVERRDLAKLIAQHEISKESEEKAFRKVMKEKFPEFYIDVVPPFSFKNDDRVKNRIEVMAHGKYLDIRTISPLLHSLYGSFNMRKIFIYGESGQKKEIDNFTSNFFSS